MCWSEQDIVKALSIRTSGLKAYNNVKELSHLPLPSVRTLNRRGSNFECKPGILHEVLAAMKNHADKMDVLARICVISFDEMSIDSRVIVDSTTGDLVSNSKVQVCMARGLTSSWKQPVYYGFNTDMTLKLLNDVILAIEGIGLKVCAIVCDLGAENRSFLKHAGVTIDKPFLGNPTDPNRNIYFFADVPHCIKNLRNHVIDDGVIFGVGKFNPEGTNVDVEVMRELVNNNGDGELKRVPYLTHSWLGVSDSERMRVRPAVQFFSHSIACLAWECFPEKPAIGNFFEIINNGFDVLNSRKMYGETPSSCAFGINIDEQLESLELFEDLVTNARFLTGKGNVRRVTLPCQTGLIMSIRSLRLLYEELQKTWNVRYILTSRVNQDCVENLFSRIRAFGGPNSHPNSIECKNRLKLLLLGSNVKAGRGSNVDTQESLHYLCSDLLQLSSPRTDKELDDANIQAEVVRSIESFSLARNCHFPFTTLKLIIQVIYVFMLFCRPQKRMIRFPIRPGSVLCTYRAISLGR